jgi:hypothetical protein
METIRSPETSVLKYTAHIPEAAVTFVVAAARISNLAARTDDKF